MRDFAELVTDLGWQRNGAWGGNEVIFQIDPAHAKAELPVFLVQNACCISVQFLLRAGSKVSCIKRRSGVGRSSNAIVGGASTSAERPSGNRSGFGRLRSSVIPGASAGSGG